MHLWRLIAEFPPWGMMWGISVVFYGLLKGVSETVVSTKSPAWRQAGYRFAWPGMDAKAFLEEGTTPVSQPTLVEWGFALSKLGLGIASVWGLAPRLIPQSERLAGWAGMVGIIFVLHFGLFHVLSCAWRWQGVVAVPLMNWPINSQSVTEFWGRRWNLAFRDLTHRFLFRPLLRRLGPTGSLLVGFVVSGLIHDLVISVPSRGGYGFPTAFFTLQGLAILVERSCWGRRVGLGHGVKGRLFCLAVIALPCPLLFHSMFVLRVIVPFLTAIGALP